MPQPHVAIVILSWNGVSFFKEYLSSVEATTYANHSIWVIDNNSTDDSLDYLSKNHPKIRVIQNGFNAGFATGYNLGLKQIEADYYILLNQDVETTPTWIDPLVERALTDDTIAVVQPRVKAAFDKRYFEYAGASGGFIDSFGVTFCRGRIFEHLEVDENQYNQSTEIFWGSGCAMFIKADVYHRFGGLDDDFFAHMEEIDLCWRIKNGGYKIVYEPTSEVFHLGGGSLPKGSPKKSYLNFRNNLSMIFKNKPFPNVLFTIPIRILIDILAAWKDLLSGNWKGFLVILKAHLYFYAHLPALFAKRRKTNRIVREQRISKVPNTNGLYKGSIIWAYMIRGIKKFSDLRMKL